ncbi:MAG: hypothetical protein ACLQDY_19600 [Streptosporangiaceae bacterium]
MAIVTLALWIFTAAAGFTLLRAGGASRRAAARRAAGSAVTGPGSSHAGSATAPDPFPATASAAGGTAVTAPPPSLQHLFRVTPDGRPMPPPPNVVEAPPGEHPLLEFSHPMLAMVGSACWLMYVISGYRPIAWISLGVLVVAIGIGLSWLARNNRAARRRPGETWTFPPRLVALHGAGAAVGIALTFLTALIAIRG